MVAERLDMNMRRDEILTLKEAAEMIGVTLGSVRQWRHWQMHGKPYRGCRIRKAGNGQLYVLRSDVDEFVKTYRPHVEEGVDNERDA